MRSQGVIQRMGAWPERERLTSGCRQLTGQCCHLTGPMQSALHTNDCVHSVAQARLHTLGICYSRDEMVEVWSNPVALRFFFLQL